MVIAAQMPSLEQIFFLVQMTADEPKTSIIFNLSKCDGISSKSTSKETFASILNVWTILSLRWFAVPRSGWDACDRSCGPGQQQRHRQAMERHVLHGPTENRNPLDMEIFEVGNIYFFPTTKKHMLNFGV